MALIVAVDPEVPRFLVGDPMRTGQILINLVNNAVKFTDHGEINVRVLTAAGAGRGAESSAGIESENRGRARGKDDAKKEALLSFSISDTGIGISKEELSRLFQSFNQADSSFTRRYGGNRSGPGHLETTG